MSTRTSLLLSLFVTFSAAACGDDSAPAGSTFCGEGTTFDSMMNRCVPEGGGATCAAGTVLMGDECVPDGTVVCAGGTMFDSMSGTCVPDIEACGEGTVEVDGTCVPFDDTLVGEVMEAMEPNDATLELGAPAMVTLPDVGGDVTISGCITPDDFDGDGVLDADQDGFLISTPEATVLDITVDGKAGLSAGFFALSAEDELASHGWIRFGVDLASDGASRKVLLPAPGDYVITVADARALFFGEPAGGMDTCYFMQVAREALPTPTPWTGESLSGTHGDPVIYSTTGTEAQLLFATMSDDSAAAGPALVGMVEGEYRISNSSQDADATIALGGIAAGEEVWIIADHTVDYAIDDVAWELTIDDAGAQQIPDGTNTVTVTHSDEVYRFLWFSANAGDVVELGFTSSDELQIDVINPTFTSFVANVTSGAMSGSSTMQIVEGGYYYVRLLNNDGTDGVDYDVTFTLDHHTPAAVTAGTPVSGSIDGNTERAYFAFDATMHEWVEWSAENLSGFGGDDARLSFYPRDEEGALGSIVPAFDIAVDDGAGLERIYGGLLEGILVVVTDDGGAPTSSQTFDLGVVDLDYTDLGTIAGGTAETRASESIAAGGVVRYLGKTDAGNLFDLTVTGAAGLDVVVEVLDLEANVIATVDAGGAGAAEMLEDLVPELGVLPFRVREATGAAGNFALQLDARLPPYVGAESSVPFVDVCPDAGGTGVVHTTVDDGGGFGADDDGLSDTPLDLSGLSFDYFGTAVTEATISTNGWLTFQPSYAGDAAYSSPGIPDGAAPNAVVAPFWDDWSGVEVCTLVETDRAVIQWTGGIFFGLIPLQVQAILHRDGTIDFVYGPGHSDDGSFSALGLENWDGSYGIPWTDPVEADSAVTFTPM